MSLPIISYSIGLPVFIEIDGDGNLYVTVDLAEAGTDIEFGYGNAHLGDAEVDGYDDATDDRIEAALRRAKYQITVVVPTPPRKESR